MSPTSLCSPRPYQELVPRCPWRLAWYPGPQGLVPVWGTGLAVLFCEVVTSLGFLPAGLVHQSSPSGQGWVVRGLWAWAWDHAIPQECSLLLVLPGQAAVRVSPNQEGATAFPVQLLATPVTSEGASPLVGCLAPFELSSCFFWASSGPVAGLSCPTSQLPGPVQL